MRRFTIHFADIVIVLLSFLLCILFKPGNIVEYFTRHRPEIILLLVIWVPISFVFQKYKPVSSRKLKTVLLSIIASNSVILGTLSIYLVAAQALTYSRLIIFGTFVLATIAEIVIFNFLHYFSRLKYLLNDEEDILRELKTKKEVTEKWMTASKSEVVTDPKVFKSIKTTISHETSPEVFNQLNQWINLCDPACMIIATTTRFNIEKEMDKSHTSIVNLRRINDIRYLNKFFEAVNAKLPKGGLFIGFAETKDLRKRRLLYKYPTGFNYIFYTIDFLIKRLLPKFKLTTWLYFFLTRGENRVLSKAETFGRLYSCGFEIVDEVYVNKHLFFLTRKVKKPFFDAEPTYGPFVKLRRLGKNGVMIRVYKFRTMHPYSEYLQEYVYNKYNLQSGGKFKDDFRVTTIGRIFRKFWLDELPMFLNFFKGELKMVGVRPISAHYFSLYSKELQEKRLKHKPGLIPPYYADLPDTIDEIMASEMKYLELYEKHPFKTDVTYFFKAVRNIVFKRARSK